MSKQKSLKQVLREIFPRVDVKKILDHYGLEYTVRGDECVMPCLFHEKLRGKPDRNPSFSINTVKKVYACWSCPAKGSVYSFVMFLEVRAGAKSCDFKSALSIVCKICDIPLDGLFEISKDSVTDDLFVEELEAENARVQEVFNDNVLSKFYLKTHNYFLDRGFLPETLKTFEMGFGTKDLDKDRCIFPVRNAVGALVGWTGRSVLNKRPKWLHRPKDRFFTTLNLYNIDKALPYILKSSQVYVVESVANCMRLWECGHKNAVATFGSTMSVEQAAMICEYAEEVYLLYDNDDAGAKGTDTAVSLLYDKDIRVFIGQYDFGVNDKGSALDIGDATPAMVESITYIDMYSYLERKGGLMRILDDELDLSEPIELNTPDGQIVMLVDKLSKNKEVIELCAEDIVRIKRIHNLFGIVGMSIEEKLPF